MSQFRLTTTGDTSVVGAAEVAIAGDPDIATASATRVLPSFNIVMWTIEDSSALSFDEVANILVANGYVTTGAWG